MIHQLFTKTWNIFQCSLHQLSSLIRPEVEELSICQYLVFLGDLPKIVLGVGVPPPPLAAGQGGVLTFSSR